MLAWFEHILQQVMFTTLQPLFLPFIPCSAKWSEPMGAARSCETGSDGPGPKKQRLSVVINAWCYLKHLEHNGQWYGHEWLKTFDILRDINTTEDWQNGQ